MNIRYTARWIGMVAVFATLGCQAPPETSPALTNAPGYSSDRNATIDRKQDLAFLWQGMVEEARAEAGVYIPSSSTGIFGGVYTMVPKVTFGLQEQGDAALALYGACSTKFSKWANENGAEASFSEGGGKKALRIKATNADYLEILYRASTSANGNGTFTVIFVDADKFNDRS